MATAVLRFWMSRFFRPIRVRGAGSKALAKALRQSVSSQHPFDRRYGVDTDGLIYADSLATGHEHDIHSAGYYATAPSLFHGAMARWIGALSIAGGQLSDFSLVDIGCGKGRVLMLASQYAFREIVGVELNPGLADAAHRNLRTWLRLFRPACTNVRAVHGDALSIPIPHGPVVIYFFNSFEQEMVRRMLDRLTRLALDRSDPIDLIYMHPEFDALVRQTPGIQLLSDTQIPFSREDEAADAFGVAVDRCTIYRFSGQPGS